MSEPIQKGEIDLKSLDSALNDTEAASEMPAETLQKNSDTLSQPPAPETRSAVGADATKKGSSPTTLSPSSPRAMSPSRPAAAPAPPVAAVPPAVAELKVMFPDLDNDTIAAVLAAHGGNQESAVNALLQMSDPSFKPSATETRTDSDALLAQTIAMEEEDRLRAQMARQQRQQQDAGRGGGGAGSFFSSFLNSDSRDQPAANTPSYDPNALTYQPRVRKTPASAAAARQSSAQPSNQPATSPWNEDESLVPGMPGPKEAKQWQEEINRMAETGLARAATTFSAFKQKASAAFNNPQEGSAGQEQAATGASSGGAGGGFAQAFQNFRNNATGKGSTNAETQAAQAQRQGLTSPRSPHASEYDQDPSPVGENELAKIISRGGGAGSGGGKEGAAGKARALAERYGLGIKNASRSNSSSSASANTGAAGETYAGWDQAGRRPISIKDNTAASTTTETKTSKVDSVSLMDSAKGRGLTSSPTKESSSGTAVAATAGAAAVVGAGAGAAAVAEHHDNDADSDDLEYVSNPFEDED